jgi:hypothetical protein
MLGYPPADATSPIAPHCVRASAIGPCNSLSSLTCIGSGRASWRSNASSVVKKRCCSSAHDSGAELRQRSSPCLAPSRTDRPCAPESLLASVRNPQIRQIRPARPRLPALRDMLLSRRRGATILVFRSRLRFYPPPAPQRRPCSRFRLPVCSLKANFSRSADRCRTSRAEPRRVADRVTTG